MQEYGNHEVVGFVVQQLAKDYPNPPVPLTAVDERIAKWRAGGMYIDLPDEAWDNIALHVKTKVIITMEQGETLAGKSFREWLPERHADIEWKRWIAYKQLLTVKGFPPGVQNALDLSTDDILNCLGDPLDEGSWKRRGLVIGDVQSGKTATYIGAVNKAADAGYKVIVLLAGGTEALRKQTQFRVDEGLIGRDSSKSAAGLQFVNNQVFGVGNWLGQFVSAQGLTTQATDFRSTSQQAMNIVIDPNTTTPYVFVLKKNKTALENLKKWLEGQQIGGSPIDLPMLVVDDESDYASVNTRADDSPTVINGLIRDILKTVSKSSYLAFTATPFANVFIDHETTDELLGDDLFPRDYIRTLEAPSNYVGSHAYFGTEDAINREPIRNLDDAEAHFPLKHKSGQIVTALPPTLLEALRTFVVAIAIREARGDSSARSMLVNVSRFKRVQEQVHKLVETEFQRIRDAIELHSVALLPGAAAHPEMAALRDIFHEHFSEAGLDWDAVVPKLKSAVHATAVKLINSDRVKQVQDIADLEAERMIAVGGDVLSRGLTLEGLTVSYFHRSVGASDTLLQMARWFGYRPGYEDLCRVWLTDDVADQFRYVAAIVTELRAQLHGMKKQGLTPADFGLMVRMHPETLRITAANKMGGAEAKAWTVDIAGRRIETTTVDSNPDIVLKNFDALKEFVAALEGDDPEQGWVDGDSQWPRRRSVSRMRIADFLEAYIPFVTDALFTDNVLSAYIRKSDNPAMGNWRVAFAKGTGTKVAASADLIVPAPKRAVKRGQAVQRAGAPSDFVPFKVSGSSARLGGSNDIARVFDIPEPENQLEPKVYEAIIGHGPALIVYLIQPNFDNVEASTEDAGAAALWTAAKARGAECLVCLKIAIPGTKPGNKGAEVRYMLNSVALNSWKLSVAEQAADDDDLDVD